MSLLSSGPVSTAQHGAAHAFIAALPRALGLSLLAVLLTVPEAAGQASQIGFRVGPTFGFLNDTTVPFTSADASTNANPRIDFHAGAYVALPLTDRISLQPELLYLQTGGHFSRPRARSYAVERYRLSYMQAAVLGRRSVSVPGPLSLHALLGVTAEVAVSGRVQQNFRSATTIAANRVDLLRTDQLRRWNVGALIGAGLGYPIGPGRIALELRYTPSFRSVFVHSAHQENALPASADNIFPLPAARSALRHDIITASLTYTLPLRPLF